MQESTQHLFVPKEKKQKRNESLQKAKLLLVGAGPGDPELLTLKAYKAIREADIILFDNLVNKEIFSCVFADYDSEDIPEMHYVGKKCAEKHISQEEIHEIILKNLKLNKSVLRLKGGDPFIFARGVEEMFLATENDFEVEVIPGLSSGIAVPAYNGIPLTLREKSDSVMLVTGHFINEEKLSLWAEFLRNSGTLVIYMGLNKINIIKDHLLGLNISPKLPAIAIQDGSLKSQRIYIGKLEDIAKELKEQEFQSPSIILLGEHIGF